MRADGGREQLIWMILLWTLSSGGALATERPATPPAAPPQAKPADAETAQAPAASQQAFWQHEIQAIADLLVDGSYGPAKERASRLLEDEGLPDDVILRAQKLFAKAAAKLRSATPEPALAPEPPVSEPPVSEPHVSEPPPPREETPAMAPPAVEEPAAEPPVAEAPPPRPRIEIHGASEKASGKPSATKESGPTVFRVRLAQPGGGFSSGVNGVLRIKGDRIEFASDAKSGLSWEIPWSDLAAARQDDGLWDCPYPLAILDRRGHQHFVAVIDARGVYLPGDPLLAAVAQGRAKRPAGKGEEPAKDRG